MCDGFNSGMPLVLISNLQICMSRPALKFDKEDIYGHVHIGILADVSSKPDFHAKLFKYQH